MIHCEASLRILIMNDREDVHFLPDVVFPKKFVHSFQTSWIKEIIDIKKEKIFSVRDSRSVVSRGISPIIESFLDIYCLHPFQGTQIKFLFIRLLLETVMNKDHLEVPKGLSQDAIYSSLRRFSRSMPVAIHNNNGKFWLQDVLLSGIWNCVLVSMARQRFTIAP